MNVTCRRCKVVNLATSQFCSNCGYPLGSTLGLPGMAPLAADTILDQRYRIIRVLGDGGMGRVYLAEDRRFNNLPCAVKEMIDPSADPVKHKQAVARFENEATLLRTLLHKHIPRVSDHFTEGARSYLVMDYVEGETLDDVIRRQNGPLPEAQVLSWADQLLEVLIYLHTHQPPIVFRDLKPSNIMRRPDDSVVVIDFGIAQQFIPHRQGTVIGTPGYAPPEQYHGRAEPRSDLYGLGATLHHLLTGSDPQSRTAFDFPLVRSMHASVSEATERAIARALEHDPAQRFATASDMRQALGLGSAPLHSPQRTPSGTVPFGPTLTRPLGPQTAKRFVGHQAPVTGVVFTRQGYTLVSVGADCRLTLWQVINDSVSLSARLQQPAWTCALSPDGQTIIVGGDKGVVEFISSNDGSASHPLVAEYARLRCVALDAAGGQLAAAGRYAPMGLAAAGEIWVWDAQSRRRMATMPHQWPICSLAFRPDGSALLTGDGEGHVSLWSLSGPRAWSRVGDLPSSLAGAYVACSPDNQSAAAVGADGQLTVWHIDSRRVIFNSDGVSRLPVARDQGMPPLAAVAYSPDGRRLAYTAPGPGVRLYTPATGQIEDVASGGEFLCLGFSPDGMTLAAGAKDGSVWLWPIL